MTHAPNPDRIMQGVIPYLAIEDTHAAIAFYKKAFGASVHGEITLMPGSDKVANACLVINGGAIMLSGAFPEQGQSAAKSGAGYAMQLVIDDGDFWWSRAVAAGAEIVTPFAKQFWGDRYGQVRDPFGIDWAFNEPSPASVATDQDQQAQKLLASLGENDLHIDRVIAASRTAVWRCWVEGDLLKQWFCPKPWSVSKVEQDVRAGGASLVVMNGPNGEVMPNPGQFVDVAPQRRLAFTDAYLGDWRTAPAKPFMSGFVEFFDAPNGATRMIWGARHWSAEDKQSHLDMGFEAGWNAAADQLEALARSL